MLKLRLGVKVDPTRQHFTHHSYTSAHRRETAQVVGQALYGEAIETIVFYSLRPGHTGMVDHNYFSLTTDDHNAYFALW
jgi:hypothetical protein